MAERRLPVRAWWTSRDFAKRVWDNAGEDNVFFLAGGIAFNILLAVVPFALLLVTGLAYFLEQPANAAGGPVVQMVFRLLPNLGGRGQDVVQRLMEQMVATGGRVGILSAITFVWFSTRLFGSLRTVLAEVFDIEQERGIIGGKLFDARITVMATLIFVAYTALTAYLALATTRGISLLEAAGLRRELMSGVEHFIGQALATLFLLLLFFSLYKFLPNRRIRWQTALIAALFTTTMFELARRLFTAYVGSFSPGTLYTGTIAAVVIVVVWVYYAAMIFVLGGEVAQVYELRRVRRAQREVFEQTLRP